MHLSDRAPQILELEDYIECNLKSSAKIICSATGNPLPSHNSIELRKMDTVIKVGGSAGSGTGTVMYSQPKQK